MPVQAPFVASNRQTMINSAIRDGPCISSGGFLPVQEYSRAYISQPSISAKHIASIGHVLSPAWKMISALVVILGQK
jgi:hypothetical protein